MLKSNLSLLNLRFILLSLRFNSAQVINLIFNLLKIMIFYSSELYLPLHRVCVLLFIQILKKTDLFQTKTYALQKIIDISNSQQ